LRGEETIAELCRREGIAQSIYYKWSKEFLEAGKRRLAGDTARAASTGALFQEKRKGGGRKRVSVKLSLSDNFPVAVKSDPTRLRQVLINLIGNAVKFTKEGRVTVEGSLCQLGDGKDILRVEINDTGIGMTAETITKLFTDFSQADASTSRQFAGTGLGLSICKRLVELMGGTIGVESEIGKGSTFWFTLPYEAATTEINDPTQASTVVTHYRTVRPLHILVAEDNRLNQRIVKATLDALKHTSEIVENGTHAVEAHERGDYDLILMDIRMPEMSGPDATKMIRCMDADKNKIPIIALTADAMAEHKRGYFEAGMDGCVTKPIDRSELVNAINKVMDAEVHISTNEEQPALAPEPPEVNQKDEEDDGEADAAVAALMKQMMAFNGNDEDSLIGRNV
jgi:two-component system, sensor histidine kinase